MGISLAASAAALIQPQLSREARPATPAEMQILAEWLQRQSDSPAMPHFTTAAEMMQIAGVVPAPQMIRAKDPQRSTGTDLAHLTTAAELMQIAGAAPVARIISPEELQRCAPGYALGLAAGLSFRPSVVGQSSADEAAGIINDLFIVAPKCPRGTLGFCCLAGFVMGSVLRSSGLVTHNDNLRRFGEVTDYAITCVVDMLHGEVLATILDGVNVFATVVALARPNQAFVFDAATDATEIVGLIADNSGPLGATCQHAIQGLSTLR